MVFTTKLAKFNSHEIKVLYSTCSSHVVIYRVRVGVAVLEGPMYAVGGHDGWSYLNTVERWDPQSKQWSFVAQMSVARSTAGVTVLGGK